MVSNPKTGKNFFYEIKCLQKNKKFALKSFCSSGQKVLACIIIRMALAEYFNLQSHILALDEPTTHLDKKNSQALARYIAQLAQWKKKDPQFVLLIITHDEEFTQYMKDLTRFYYEIYKNEKGFSKVSKKSF